MPVCASVAAYTPTEHYSQIFLDLYVGGVGFLWVTHNVRVPIYATKSKVVSQSKLYIRLLD